MALQTGEEYDLWMGTNPVPELPEGYVWGRGNGTHCTYYLEVPTQPHCAQTICDTGCLSYIGNA
jgi:hypothetical protein